MEKLVVVGGGPAGVAAAVEAARLGLQVTLVTSEAPGGRANWHSLLPSKVFLHAAEQYAAAKNMTEKGRSAEPAPPAIQEIKSRIERISRGWHAHLAAELQAQQVQVISGKATFSKGRSVEVQADDGSTTRLSYDKAILATGSVPIFIPQLKPDGQVILAPRFAAALKRWPEHIVIIGAGATGSEYAYLYAQMGSQVTWITDMPEILPRFDPDITAGLESALLEMGITIMKDSPVTGVLADMGGVVVTIRGGRAIAASHAFIAIGRRADLDGLNLEAVGIEFARQGVQVNGYGQTSNPDIYAVGDAAGIPYTANKGLLQAYTAARHLAGQAIESLRYDLLIEAVFTSPALAQVGLNQKAAQAQGVPVRVFNMHDKNLLISHIHEGMGGNIRILTDHEGKIMGGAAVGHSAPDRMALVATAMRAGMQVDELSGLFPAYPTESELIPQELRNLR